MVMVPLTDRISMQSILPIKVSFTIDTMLYFDGDFVKHGDGDGTCKQTLTREMLRIFPSNLNLVLFFSTSTILISR